MKPSINDHRCCGGRVSDGPEENGELKNGSLAQLGSPIWASTQSTLYDDIIHKKLITNFR